MLGLRRFQLELCREIFVLILTAKSAKYAKNISQRVQKN